MNGVSVINPKKLRQSQLKQLLDLAGFKVIIREREIELIDKENPDADKYADLTFDSLNEAVMTVQHSLRGQFSFV